MRKFNFKFLLALLVTVTGFAGHKSVDLVNQYAAIMSVRAQYSGLDGLAPTQIFIGERFGRGDRLILENAFGRSIGRVHHGKASAVSDCPQNWTVNFIDAQRNILSAVEDLGAYYGPGLEVPRGAVAAFIGFTDSAYFDNEGKRWAKKGSTNGCTFRLTLVTQGGGGGGGGCFNLQENQLLQVARQLNELVRLAARYEDRGQTEFTSRAAIQDIRQNLIASLKGTCSKVTVLGIRDQLRNRLDGVRTAFRASAVLSAKADAFQAFKDVVTAWETFRDSVSDL